LRLPAQQRLRVRRIIGISIRKLLRRDAAVLLQRYIFQKKVEGNAARYDPSIQLKAIYKRLTNFSPI
jgi:hypothetical protein